MEFREGALDAAPGANLVQAMRDEIAVMYDGLELDGDHMPRGGPAELSPPTGAFIVGFEEEHPVCCGGIKRLDDDSCELKRMYVSPQHRGRGIGRALLHALEERARSLGYRTARLDTGPKNVGAQPLFESEGYEPIENFNHNPVAVFWGEKPL